MNHAERVLGRRRNRVPGGFVVQALKRRGYWVRGLTRVEGRLHQPGPFTAPGIGRDDVDDVFVGQLTEPSTLVGLMDGIDIVFSCVGISRQRDRLTFEQVNHQCNRTLIEMALEQRTQRFVYVSMHGAERPDPAGLAITVAHESVVDELKSSGRDLAHPFTHASFCRSQDPVEIDAAVVEAKGRGVGNGDHADVHVGAAVLHGEEAQILARESLVVGVSYGENLSSTTLRHTS